VQTTRANTDSGVELPIAQPLAGTGRFAQGQRESNTIGSFSITWITQLGPPESTMHNLSAAKATGFYLSAFIDQRCFDENAHA